MFTNNHNSCLNRPPQKCLEDAQAFNSMFHYALSNSSMGNILRHDEVRDHTNLHSQILIGPSCFWRNRVSPEKLSCF